ncbi:MAG: DUF4340 domain-containing protein [Candidatus Aminicenantes bacterium]|nr:DUF4340 domain-containing protein [Candidatus Aminicenantes bacterium]
MKFKTTIILAVILIILLAFVFIFESKDEGENEKEGKLVALSSDDIQKITLQREDKTISFEKTEKDEWLITQPLEAKADKYEVDRLASDFSDLQIERVVEEEPEELKKYEIPQKEISLWLKDKNKPVKILVGMENPLDKTFFAKRDDETRVVLISSQLKDLMEKSLFDFRQKDIFRFETDEVKSVKLKAKKIFWEATKKEEEWFLEKPVKSLANTSKIDNLLTSLSNLKAKEFVSEKKNKDEIKKYSLENPDYKITLFMPLVNQELTFSLHKEEEKLYATTSLSSKIIEVEDALLSDLEKEAEELREKEVANFYSWEVNRLHIKKGDINWTFVKDEEDNWSFESPDEGEADKNKIQTFIRKIESLEAEEFIDPPLSLKDHGLDSPQGEVKIWWKGDEEKVQETTILIGYEDKEAKKVVVKNTRFNYLFRVDKAFLEEFPKETKDWKPEEKEEEKEKQ